MLDIDQLFLAFDAGSLKSGAAKNKAIAQALSGSPNRSRGPRAATVAKTAAAAAAAPPAPAKAGRKVTAKQSVALNSAIAKAMSGGGSNRGRAPKGAKKAK